MTNLEPPIITEEVDTIEMTKSFEAHTAIQTPSNINLLPDKSFKFSQYLVLNRMSNTPGARKLTIKISLIAMRYNISQASYYKNAEKPLSDTITLFVDHGLTIEQLSGLIAGLIEASPSWPPLHHETTIKNLALYFHDTEEPDGFLEEFNLNTPDSLLSSLKHDDLLFVERRIYVSPGKLKNSSEYHAATLSKLTASSTEQCLFGLASDDLNRRDTNLTLELDVFEDKVTDYQKSSSILVPNDFEPNDSIIDDSFRKNTGRYSDKLISRSRPGSKQTGRVFLADELCIGGIMMKSKLFEIDVNLEVSGNAFKIHVKSVSNNSALAILQKRPIGKFIPAGHIASWFTKFDQVYR